jgi:hypothetical protein
MSHAVAGNCIEYFTLTFALRYVQLPSFTVAEELKFFDNGSVHPII